MVLHGFLRQASLGGPHSLRVILIDHALDKAALLGTLAGVVLRAVPAMGGRHGAAGLQIDRSRDADHLRHLIVADEATRGLWIFGVDINGARNRLPHGCQHLELNITHRVDGISAKHLQNLCGFP